MATSLIMGGQHDESSAEADLGDGGGVGDHADGALDLGKVAAGHDGRRLVVDAALEPGGAPVDELDRALGLDRRDRRVDVLGHHVAAVHQAARHVLRARGAHEGVLRVLAGRSLRLAFAMHCHPSASQTCCCWCCSSACGRAGAVRTSSMQRRFARAGKCRLQALSSTL